MRVLVEARTQVRSPGAEVTSGCEPPDVSAETELGSPTRAEHILSPRVIFLVPGS